MIAVCNAFDNTVIVINILLLFKCRKDIDLMCCRLRELTEGKRPVCGREITASSPDTIDMNPVVRIAVESELQSLAANDISKQRKRKRDVLKVNGSIECLGEVNEKNSCSLENCEENIRRKKRKKLTPSEQVDSAVCEGEERHNTVASDLTAAAASNDSKSALEDEVEIWIPNKKYKGPLRDVYATLAGEGSWKVKHNSPKKDDSLPFMTFIPVDKTPTALVRRRNKFSHSEPKELRTSVSFVSICSGSILLRTVE